MHPLIARPWLLTIQEYVDVGEVEPGYSELVEGRMFLTPTPSADHQRRTDRDSAAAPT